MKQFEKSKSKRKLKNGIFLLKRKQGNLCPMTDLKGKICPKSFIYLLDKLIIENNFISFVLYSVKKKEKKN